MALRCFQRSWRLPASLSSAHPPSQPILKRSMYTKLAEIPVPTGAQFVSGSDRIQISYSVRDHERNVKRSLVKNAFVPKSGDAVSLPAHEVNHVAARYSPSGLHRVVLREVRGEGSGSKKYFVELWTGDSLSNTLDVTSEHDAFYADDSIGTLSWSHDESSIVYVAETQVEKEKVDADPYAKFRYRADLGEGLSGKRRPTAFIINWKDASVSRVTAPDHLYFGQHIFSPSSSKTLYASAYELQPDWRLLGVKGCFNRPRGIWRIDLADDGKATVHKLTDPQSSSRSPRIVGDKVVWLAEATGGPHVSTSTVVSQPLSGNDAVTTVLDVVDKPKEDGFPGLYAPSNFPASPTLVLDSKPHLVVQTALGSRTVPLLVGLEDGKYTVLDAGEEWSWNVFGTDGKSRVLCSRSNPAVPYEILVGDVSQDGSVKWQVVDRPTLSDEVSEALALISSQIIKIPGREPTETIVIQSSSNDKVASHVLVPHGGPHGTSTTAFNAATTAMVLSGYTVSQPNYTGSPGFGDSAIRALVGQCGRLDVDDCILSLDHLVKLGIAQDGPGKVFVMGGSHGGFLAAHLIGQFPDRFTAASMRNPVISGGDTTTTDIPDWYYSEFGFNYPVQSSSKSTTITSEDGASHSSNAGVPPLMTSETFGKLQKASPISYVDAVKTPVRLLVGLSDRRVAPSQGIEYYHALKARAQDKSDVDLLVFEGESHPLDGVEAARVCYEAARDWFDRFRAKAGI